MERITMKGIRIGRTERNGRSSRERNGNKIKVYLMKGKEGQKSLLNNKKFDNFDKNGIKQIM